MMKRRRDFHRQNRYKKKQNLVSQSMSFDGQLSRDMSVPGGEYETVKPRPDWKRTRSDKKQLSVSHSLSVNQKKKLSRLQNMKAIENSLKSFKPSKLNLQKLQTSSHKKQVAEKYNPTVKA